VCVKSDKDYQCIICKIDFRVQDSIFDCRNQFLKKKRDSMLLTPQHTNGYPRLLESSSHPFIASTLMLSFSLLFVLRTGCMFLTRVSLLRHESLVVTTRCLWWLNQGVQNRSIVELITPHRTTNYHGTRKGGQGPVWAVAPLIIITGCM
jgi:hypothetical protein